MPRPAQAVSTTACTPAADFDFSLSPHAIILLASGSSGSTISVTPIYGFTGAIALSVPSRSPNISPQFSPTTLNIPGGPTSSTFTVTNSTPIAPGDYAFEIDAASGTLAHSSSITVHVPTAEIGITADKFFLPLPQNTQGSFNVAVTSLYGFSGDVMLATVVHQIFPGSAPTAAPSPASLTLSVGSGDQSSIVAVSATPTTSPGFYAVEVDATSSTITNSTSVYVEVIGPSIGINADHALSVPLGSTKDTVVNITSIENFHAPVSLTVAVLSLFGGPPTASVSPPSVDLTVSSLQKSTLTIDATGPSTTVGAYLVNVTGTSGSLWNSTIVSVTVGSPNPGFSLTASPSVLAMPQAATLTSMIAFQPSNGFSDTVNLSLLCDPVGLTASLNLASIAASQTSTLTVSTTSLTQAGSYTIDVSGIGTTSPASNDTIVDITVIGPDFSLTPSSPTASITTGSTSTATITATALYGFTGTISLSTPSVLPLSGGTSTGLTASLDTTSLQLTGATATASATLTLIASAAGVYIVSVEGTSGSLVHPASIEITVTAPSPDFSLNANPAGITVQQGSSGTSAISLAGANGFTGAATLSIPNLSAGITTSFSYATVSGALSSTLTIDVANTVAAGSYNVHVSGISGSLTRGADITVTVTAASYNPPDITIAFGSSSLRINTGASGVNSITITPVYGFSGSVNLSVSAPSALTCSLDHHTIQSSGSASTLNLTCSGNTPGDYTVTITATGGTSPKQTTMTVHVVNASPSPTPSQPANILGLNPTIFYAVIGGIIVLLGIVGAGLVLRSRKQ